MTPAPSPLQVTVGALTISASSRLEARRLADALPGALQQALDGRRFDTAKGSRVVSGGVVAPHGGTSALAQSVARRIVELAFPAPGGER